jgi:hypothetical protein
MADSVVEDAAGGLQESVTQLWLRMPCSCVGFRQDHVSSAGALKETFDCLGPSTLHLGFRGIRGLVGV